MALRLQVKRYADSYFKVRLINTSPKLLDLPDGQKLPSHDRRLKRIFRFLKRLIVRKDSWHVLTDARRGLR